MCQGLPRKINEEKLPQHCLAGVWEVTVNFSQFCWKPPIPLKKTVFERNCLEVGDRSGLLRWESGAQPLSVRGCAGEEGVRSLLWVTGSVFKPISGEDVALSIKNIEVSGEG